MAYKIKWDEKGATTRFYGRVSLEEITEANNNHYSDPRLDDISYQLFDFTNADLSKLTFEDVKYPAAIDKAATIYKPFLKVALAVAPNDQVAKSLCEAYVKFSLELNSKWKFGIFESYDEAMTWCLQ